MEVYFYDVIRKVPIYTLQCTSIHKFRMSFPDILNKNTHPCILLIYV